MAMAKFQNVNWSPTENARLKKLWEGGNYSAAQIAEKMGLTRGQVLGKITRMEWVKGSKAGAGKGRKRV